MSGSETQNRWLEKVVEQLRSLEGVEDDVAKDGRIALRISYNGESRKVFLAGAEPDYRTQKNQLSQLRKTLTTLGIIEGQQFVPVKRSRKPITPEMLAARAKRQEAFEAWQEVWRTIRKAEHSLDVEYELSQMMDYY